MSTAHSYREKVYEYIVNKYQSKIEYLWLKYPNYAVFRNNSNNKWYGIVMDVPYKKLGIDKEGKVDILNVKVADFMQKCFLTNEQGILNGYHIARGNWISILLNGTVKINQIYKFIDESFDIVNKTAKKH